MLNLHGHVFRTCYGTGHSFLNIKKHASSQQHILVYDYYFYIKSYKVESIKKAFTTQTHLAQSIVSCEPQLKNEFHLIEFALPLYTLS